MRAIHLNGHMVCLNEVTAEYFPYIIAWRNDPVNNQYLNQPFHLDMEKQRAWYEPVSYTHLTLPTNREV